MNLINNKFWIVTKPTRRSVLADILFQADMKDLRAHFLGGLKPEDVIGMFENDAEAEAFAVKILEAGRE